MTRYITERGSSVEVSGAYNGIHDILFDWFEEGACCEAHPVAEIHGDDAMLIWSCACCPDGGSARLRREDNT